MRTEPVSHVEFVIAFVTALLLVTAVGVAKVYDRVQTQRASDAIQSLNAGVAIAAAPKS